MAPRDDQDLTRRRLGALAAPPEVAAPPARPATPTDVGRHSWRTVGTALDEPDPPEPLDAPGSARVLVSRPAGRWQERWVPARWRGGRWDPGRRGGLALAAVAAVAAVLAAVGVWRERPVPEAAPALPAVAAAARTSSVPAVSTTTTAPTELVVSVAGAVLIPGLVHVPPGARVADAIAAAGGAVPGTDLVSLNLAQPVSDGEQVVVGAPGPPAVGAPAAAQPTSPGPVRSGSASPAGGAAAGSASGKVNLNTADATALDTLPGVGPVTAQAIVDYRTENGAFASVDQLTEVTGIGDARLATLRDLVVV